VIIGIEKCAASGLLRWAKKTSMLQRREGESLLAQNSVATGTMPAARSSDDEKG